MQTFFAPKKDSFSICLILKKTIYLWRVKKSLPFNRRINFNSLSLQAPADFVVEMEIIDFDLAPRMNTSNARLFQKCLNESMEVRLSDDYHGTFYCENDLKSGSKLISTRSKMIVIVMAEKPMIGKGLKADIKFVKKSETTTIKPNNRSKISIFNRTIKPNSRKTTPFKWILRTTTFKPFTGKPWTDVWSKINKIEQGKVVKKIHKKKQNNVDD